MRVLVMDATQSLFRGKGKCQIYKKSWDALNTIVYDMIEDIAYKANTQVKGQERGTITPADMMQAYNAHKANYEADLVEKVVNRIMEDLESIKKEEKAFHEPQTDMLDGTE